MAAEQKARDYQDRLNKLGVKEDQHFSALTAWTAKSEAKVKSTVIKKRFEDLKARREADLDQRRMRLAEKLLDEDARLKQELVSMQETPEERRAKLAARARELANRREEERQAVAQKLYEQAFAENCDVLRTTQSKRILYRTLEERTAQIESKMAAKIMEEEEKRMYHEMNEQERLKSEQRYMDDKRRQREAREATNKILDEQVRLVNAQRSDAKEARLQEIKEMRALWDKMAEEAAREEAMELERMRKLAADLAEFNLLKQSEMSEKDRKERELDLKILQEALAREADDEGREQAARAKRIADAQHYREQLARMMHEDAEDDAERDAMIQRVFDEQQAKYDAVLAAREEARRKLMEEVHLIRQEQIMEKHQRRQAELDEILREREQFALEEERFGKMEAQKRSEARKKALLQKLEIQTQMVAKAHMAAAMEVEKLAALEVAQKTEAAYMDQVKDTLGRSQPGTWHGRKKFDFYS